jgi:DNA transformation protein and related proteins
VTAVSSIPNLGPSSQEAFHRAGITTAEEIREMGADAAYLRLLQSGSRPHFIGYYVLVMGLQGRPWNDCRDAEKKDLRKRFDLLKAQAKRTPSEAKDRARLDALFDEIGLIARR